MNQHNPIWQDGKNIFGYGNGISICQDHAHFREVYSFYSTSENHAINHFYLNNIDYLKKFKNFFVKKANKLIQKSENNKFILPKEHLKSDWQVNATGNKKPILELPILERTGIQEVLTEREKSCLFWLVKGKSSKDIGNILCLSKRTVENYIANMKSKLSCKKASELVRAAIKLGIDDLE